MEFEVKASNDAHLALSQYYGIWKNNSYEIVIGGWINKKSVIRKCDQCKYSKSFDHSPLKADEYRPFWISWEGGLIKVGSGKQPNGVFLEWQDPDPIPVNYIGIRTGWGSTGSWKFNNGE